MLSRGPVKCPSTPNQPAPMTTAGGGAEDQRIAGFRLCEEAEPLRSRLSRKVPSEFFRPLNGARRAPSNGTKTILGTRYLKNHPQGGTGGETWPHVAPPSAGRRWAAGPPQVLPPT